MMFTVLINVNTRVTDGIRFGDNFNTSHIFIKSVFTYCLSRQMIYNNSYTEKLPVLSILW